MTPSRLLVVRGARRTEKLLVDRVEALADAARGDVALLARPVRVVVPSISLRDHLAVALLRRARRAVAGVRVMTLWNVVLDLLAKSGRVPGRGTALFDVLVRRFARNEPALRRTLDDLHDGYGVVATTVRELFDAGFEPVHAEAVDELLQADVRRFATAAEVERARALLRTAAATQLALDELGSGHRSALLREARDVLEESGPELLPSRALLVHGFADPSGVVSDLVESLLRVVGGEVYLDRPPDGTGGVESAHTSRFAVRLAPVARLEEEKREEEEGDGEVELFVAPEPEAEMREVARRIRGLLGDGARPESIGVVTRETAGLAATVRRHFSALGIPYSGLAAAGPLRPAGRDLALLAELLRRGPSFVLERWLDAVRHVPAGDVLTPSERSDLRLTFFALGASRLADTTRLELPPDDGDAAHRQRLAAATAAARALAADLGKWQERRATFAEHRKALERLVDHHLGWSEDGEARRAVTAFFDEVDIPGALALDWDELVLVAAEAFRRHQREALGGRGGGVQVLSAGEARGRTFDYLFVCGTNRDVFPRPVREDPLLPDRLRRGVARLLPDLPIRSAGFDEERYFFAQLLSAAPRVVVSWHEADALGAPRSPSPLAERLLPAQPVRAPRLLSAVAAERPVEEELLLRAVHGGREAFAELVPAALATAGGAGRAGLAAGRLAVLAELDPDRGHREGRARAARLGPYLGFVGPIRDETDPRRDELYVTTLENLGVCPWQTFLRRVLGLRPMPDPLGSLPSLRGLLVGNLVHQVLERVGTGMRGGGTWPEPAELERLVAGEAARVLREHGLGLKGLVRAAAEQARPFLDVARELDLASPGFGVEAVEATGALVVPDRDGRRRRVRFRADRVDAGGGRRRITDYKTGARPATSADVREDVLRRLRAGEWLQAAAYVHQGGASAEGRYLFLRPDLEEDERILAVAGGDEALREAFEASLRNLLAAWDDGAFFPRLVEPDEDVEPPRCRSCRLAEACLRRDSGTRGRLRRWAEKNRDEAVRKGLGGAQASWLDLWLLRGGS